MNRTNSQFGFAMGLDLSEDVLRVIAYHEGYGQRIHNLYASTTHDSRLLKPLLNKLATELQYTLSNPKPSPGFELSPLQRAVTQLLLVQVGDVKLHNTVQHVEDLNRNLRVILAHPMSSGDRKVVVFIQGQAYSEKARLNHLVRERKMSILKGLENGKGSGEGDLGGRDSGREGGKEEGFWKGLGRRIKKSFSGGSGESK